MAAQAQEVSQIADVRDGRERDGADRGVSSSRSGGDVRRADSRHMIYRAGRCSPLAMDIEWAPNFRKGQPENPTALVQLSDGQLIVLVSFTCEPVYPTDLPRLTRLIFAFQVHMACMSTAPLSLARILTDPETMKLGVGIKREFSHSSP